MTLLEQQTRAIQAHAAAEIRLLHAHAGRIAEAETLALALTTAGLLCTPIALPHTGSQQVSCWVQTTDPEAIVDLMIAKANLAVEAKLFDEETQILTYRFTGLTTTLITTPRSAPLTLEKTLRHLDTPAERLAA